ncbi:MAG: nitrous oxide-stimulated promoter family protein [Saccharofermentans sp.]|nr:nitrous oxide-stimulated promoter family protein [Saccharofermentans sp.]
MKDIWKKREQEKRTVSEMISLYCRKNHGTRKGVLCDDCRKLTEYAFSRCDRCPFMANKTFCSNCKVHCYAPDMREKICVVMRYSGPRMIFHHPVMAIRHVIESKKERRRINNGN